MSRPALKGSTLQRQIYDGLIAYRKDPIGFMTNVLDVQEKHVWSGMRRVAESVRDHQFTAVPSGHDLSKTYTAARIALWFKTCFLPSTVITTAPSDNQVRNQLWREIHAAYAGARTPLGGQMLTLMWNVKPEQEILDKMPAVSRAQFEKNFAIGFSTSPDTVTNYATKMQGWHNHWLLIILDEWGGIHPMITKTVVDSLIINKRCKVLGIGNPTDPFGPFAQACKPGSAWNVVHLSIKDSPNYIHNQEVVPGLAGREYRERIVKEYGEDSNEDKIRCLGEFPEYAEGTFLGQQIAYLERNGYIGDYPWLPELPVYTFGDYGDMYSSILFVQFPRDGRHVIDYFYDDTGMGVPGICKMFDLKPYNYARDNGHWCGPDYDPQEGSNRKSIATGTLILSEFARLNHRMNVCKKHSFDDGIAAARDLLPTCRIDKRCMDFVDAIKQYKKRKNLQYSTEDKPAYFEDPEPSAARHPADAYRHFAWVFRNQLVVNGQRIGLPEPLMPAHVTQTGRGAYGNWNVLNGLRRRT
jgi:hypothetical protein